MLSVMPLFSFAKSSFPTGPFGGVLLLLIGIGLFTVNDSVSKLMIDHYPAGQIIFTRAAFAMIPTAIIVWRAGGLGALRVNRPFLQAVRSGFWVMGSALLIVGLSVMPQATTTAILFSSPLMMAVLAGPLLGEHVGRHRWVAVGFGFLGMLVIMRPDTGVEAAALLVFAAAFLFSMRDILTRLLAQIETPAAMVFWSMLAALLSGLATAPFDVPVLGGSWRAMESNHVALLMMVGIFSGCGHLIVNEAYRRAEASLLAPFKYASFLWAAALGFLIWGDIPGLNVLAGAAILIASGLLLVYRETRRATSVASKQTG